MSTLNTKIHIKSIGSGGDGIGQDKSGKSWYIPATFPDEIIESQFITPRGKGIAGYAVNIVNPSPHRQTEPCKHAKTCGGCALQHMDNNFYQSWQIEMVQEVLARNEIEVPVKLAFQTEPHTRRRATFHILHEENGVKVGFYNSFSQTIESIKECLVIDENLAKIIPVLQKLFGIILKVRKQAEASVTLCENGLDILLKFPKKLKNSQLEVLNSYIDKGHFIRLSIQQNEEQPYTLWQTQKPFVNFGKTKMPITSGGFLQATKSGENAIVKTVIKDISDSKNILELFAGNGTITLPLLEQGKKVTAVEIDSNSLRMLRQGATKYAQQLSVVEKNLFTEDYSTEELNIFDCIVLDPPRAGAKKQIKAISQSKIPKVVMVSCNIKSFSQDSYILISAGYILDKVSIIDQFLWTPHVEVIGIFNKQN